MIRIYEGRIRLDVEKPNNMTAEAFDEYIDEHYLEIEDSMDDSEAIRKELTDPAGPLHGFNVKVVIDP